MHFDLQSINLFFNFVNSYFSFMIFILEHSLLEHYLTIVRKQPSSSHFRYCWKKISEIVSVLVTKDLQLQETFDENGNFLGYKFTDTMAVVSIFPSGIQLAKAFVGSIPNAKIGYLSYSFGAKKEEIPEETLCLLPEDLTNSKVLICDAIIKTGNTIKNAISRLQIENVSEISIVSVFATTEGIENIRTEFPTIPIFICSLESKDEMEDISFLELYLRYYNL